MIEALKIMIDNYYNVLSKLGYARQRETNTLLVLSFLWKFMCYKSDNITKDEIKKLNDMFECLIDNSCLSINIPYEILPLVSPSHESSGEDLFIVVPDGNLPTEDIDTNKIYLVPRLDENGDPTNVYVEYFYTSNHWEALGESNNISTEDIDKLFI